MSHIKSLNTISPRTDFGKPPKGYVAGAGRGAVGFTTRSDIGPARQAVVPIDRSISAQKERARQILLQRQLGIQPNQKDNNINGNIPAQLPATPSSLIGSIPIPMIKEEDLSESNYDAFNGYSAALFSTTNYDEEDHEADNIYDAIDKRMDSKRKLRRELREKEQWDEYHRKRPKVHEFFIQEKKELEKLSSSDWENIPDAIDLSFNRKNKKNNTSTRSEKYTPVPDSVIENARRGANTTTATVDEIETRYGGFETRILPLNSGIMSTSSNNDNAGSDLTQLGRARDKHLGIQLDKMADSVTGQTVVDPKGYLTDLTSFQITSDTDISDIRKARQLLKSVITTNPNHPPGWIAAGRLEEAAGKIQAARILILRGTDACPLSEDIWLECARLHNIKEAKAILAKAVNKIPKSVKIWMKASSLETDLEAKKAVLRRALEFIPNSVALWKAAIELEEKEDNARILLSRAVECVPNSIEMWLALARLETYENAKKVINEARKYNPTDPSIYVAAAKLEERNKNYNMIKKIIEKAILILNTHRVVVDREQWLLEASKCENQNCPLTCQAIVEQTINIDVDYQDRKDRFLQEAKEWIKKKHIVIARSIYSYLLKEFPDKWKIWWDAAILEKKYGTPLECDNILKKAVTYCRQAVRLWLLAAKEKWQTLNDIDGARQILKEANNANPKSEQIWLAAVKIEISIKDYAKAQKILKDARNECDTAKVWMKSAMLERLLGNNKEEEDILEQGIKKFPGFDKLWMMRIQLAERCKNDIKFIRNICQNGIKECPQSINLWLEYHRIELNNNNINKARSVLEQARIKISNCDILYLYAAKLELIADNNNYDNHKNLDEKSSRGVQIAKSLLSKGLQDCPNSGLLYSYRIDIEPLVSKKSICVEAIKKCTNNVYAFTSIAKYFGTIRKIRQSRDWFERAVTCNNKWGDTWAYYLKYLKQYGTLEQQEELIKRCIEAEPTHGFLWVQISKKIGHDNLTTKDILLQVVELIQSS